MRPLHPLLLELLETYATNVLSQGTSGRGSQASGVHPIGCVPFTEAEIFARFSSPSLGQEACMCAPGATGFITEPPPVNSHEAIDLTPQLLFLYYMLYIYDQEVTLRFSETRSGQSMHRLIDYNRN